MQDFGEGGGGSDMKIDEGEGRKIFFLNRTDWPSHRLCRQCAQEKVIVPRRIR